MPAIGHKITPQHRATVYIGFRGDTRELFVWKEFAPGETLEKAFNAENRPDALTKLNLEREKLNFPVLEWFFCLMLRGDEDLDFVYTQERPMLIAFEGNKPVKVLKKLTRDSIESGLKYALVMRHIKDEGVIWKG